MTERNLANTPSPIGGLGSTRERSALSDSLGAVHWLFVLTVVLLTRFSWAPTFLGTDRVNLAYALEEFDPLRHQPHPPGYPMFVALARVVQHFTSNVEVTFWTISVIATVLASWLLYLLAERMASRWVATASVILFLLSPVLWFCRLRSPLRPWLAVFSLLVGYCAWRAWTGDRRFALWGAIALGVGTGFRPDLLAYLLPIWAVSAWKADSSWKPVAKGGAIVAVFLALWFVVVASAMGGIPRMLQTITAYLAYQSHMDSLLYADTLREWLRPISRLVIWNSMAVVGWVWAPIVFYRRLATARAPWMFLVIWLAPGILFQLFVHIGEPGHTLFATPIFCLLGAVVVFSMGRYRDATLAIAALVNAALFLNAIPLGVPPSPESPALVRMWMSLQNSVAYGTFETSLERLRWTEEMRTVSVDELWRLRSPGRPTVIVALNGNDREFDFINWRVVSYYMKDQPLSVLMDDAAPGQSGRLRQVRGMSVETSPESTIALPPGGRVLWIMQPDGRFHHALESRLPVNRGRYILYSDIPSDPMAFEIEGFRFTSEAPAGDGKTNTVALGLRR